MYHTLPHQPGLKQQEGPPETSAENPLEGPSGLEPAGEPLELLERRWNHPLVLKNANSKWIGSLLKSEVCGPIFVMLLVNQWSTQV